MADDLGSAAEGLQSLLPKWLARDFVFFCSCFSFQGPVFVTATFRSRWKRDIRETSSFLNAYLFKSVSRLGDQNSRSPWLHTAMADGRSVTLQGRFIFNHGDLLGQGCAAQVYRGQDVTCGRAVAVKIYKDTGRRSWPPELGSRFCVFVKKCVKGVASRSSS